MGSYWSSTENQDPPKMANQRDNSFQPKKLRKPGVTILKKVLETIKLDENLIRENNEILKNFLSTFIDEMKKDELFRSLYQKPHYTGSFYSDLRISKPNEFDINLVLKLPFKPSDFEINYHPQVPSYAKYRLRNPDILATAPRKLNNLFKDGFLVPDKVRTWMQSVVDKALTTYKQPYYIHKIDPSSSGPARTMKLQKQKGGIIDIDLVPVISCTLETKQPGIDGRVCAKFGQTLETFLVPKPYSSTGQAPINVTEMSRLWRTHFPIAEEKLIHDLGCVKPVIKLLKLYRDAENWKIIASYYLKTVVMWMILENNDKEYWKEDKMDVRFIDALKKLSEFVKDRKIPYFFSKKHNLISKMNFDQACNINNRLCAHIKEVQEDPNKLWVIFHVRPTF